MELSKVKAVLFVKDLEKVTSFYSEALGMDCLFSDENHSALHCHGFDLIVHQIPKHIASGITIKYPPERRVGSAIRLDYPVQSVEDSRRLAKSLGGGIDDFPPEWAGKNANFFFGYDPEGNQFGVSQYDFVY